MSFSKERTQNILKVYEYLLESKLIEDKADFCRQVGLTTTQFGRIQAGEIFFPQDNEVKLVGKFYVNVNFIYHGRRKMLWASDPVKDIFVMDKAIYRDKMEMRGKFRSLENVDGDSNLMMN